MTSWTIWDIYLAPMSFLENFIACLTFGTSLTLIVYILQMPLSSLCNKLDSKKSHWVWKTVVEQLFYLIGAEACVATWRGWWMLYAGYLQIGSSAVAGPWIGSVGGLFLLMRILSGSSVICKGVLVDGEYGDGEGGILSTEYIRYLIKKKLSHSEKEMEQSVELQDMPI